MSKFVKALMTDEFAKKFENLDAAIAVNMAGLTANQANQLRGELESKGISVMVVRNLLAARATEGKATNAMFKALSGASAVCWGGEDIVALAKEVVRLAEDKRFPKFEAKGGCMDGEAFPAEMVKEISKWPSRAEQLSMLVGQILGPGSQLSAAITGPGSALASQIAQKAEEDAPAEAAAV
jgi:large subunit ribosomal protein L10